MPTAIASDGENFYVGNLDTFPIKDSSKIMQITPSGRVTVLAIGFPNGARIGVGPKGQTVAAGKHR